MTTYRSQSKTQGSSVIGNMNKEKVDGHRTQRIQIIYNYIGAVALPEKHEKNGIADIHDYAEFFKRNKSLSEALSGTFR